MGVSVVPAMAVSKHSGCRFVRLSDDHMGRRVGLVQLRHRFPTRAQRALIEELRHHARAERTNQAH
jgi:DNA-binding transcriptional LysR family regulator